MKNFTKPTICLFALMLCLFQVNANESRGDEYTLDKVYKIDPDGNLDLRTNDAKITITGSNRKDVHLKVFRSVKVKGVFTKSEDRFKIEVEEFDGDLIIRENNRSYKSGLLVYTEEVYRITIEIPLGVSLKLKGDDDDYDISDVNGNIKLDVDDGDVFLENCQGNKFDITIEDGNLDMSGGNGALWLSLDDGDLKARNCNFNDVEIRANDGNVRLETSIVSDGNYTFKTDDGSVDLKIKGGGGEFDIRHDDGRVRATSDFQMAYAGENRHKFKLAGGNAKVFVRTNDGRVSLATY